MTELLFQDDFTIGSDPLGSDWMTFGSGVGDARFDRKNVSVHDGYLDLKVAPSADGTWRGAGAILDLPRIYGDFRVRLKVDAAKRIHVVALLWPASGAWSREVDFFEQGEMFADRQGAAQTLHWPNFKADGVTLNVTDDGSMKAAPDHNQKRTTYEGDFTRWQTVGVKWTPGKLSYYAPGQRVTIRNEAVPDIPMRLHLQVAAEKGVTPLKEAGMQVSLVKVFV